MPYSFRVIGSYKFAFFYIGTFSRVIRFFLICCLRVSLCGNGQQNSSGKYF
ncbi:hypothetical protein FW781_02295 (plasmid) [Chryseobacterium panacisoli]|uniref:Uncharacterized protein n=1 Tax=Chryseobacterium panacisoli TaxID=1807141 RepID=A0A5D8ZW37_9FLAO|nr:hypothetical protein FW781_02295 [Chryseobacterium panacisoli]